MFNVKTTMLYLSFEFLSRKCGWLRERKWGFHCLCAIVKNWQTQFIHKYCFYDILLGGNALFMHVCINVERWHFILQYIWGCCHADISSFIVCGMWETDDQTLSVSSIYAQNYEIHIISLSFRCEMVTSNVSQTMTFSR